MKLETTMKKRKRRNWMVSLLIFGLVLSVLDVQKNLTSSKYAGILIILDLISFFIIILLAVSAGKAYRYMTEKDKIMLFHFVFLEISLTCKTRDFYFYDALGKTISYLLGALYNLGEIESVDDIFSFYIFVENLGFLAFFVACSFNLYKW